MPIVMIGRLGLLLDSMFGASLCLTVADALLDRFNGLANSEVDEGIHDAAYRPSVMKRTATNAR